MTNLWQVPFYSRPTDCCKGNKNSVSFNVEIVQSAEINPAVEWLALLYFKERYIPWLFTVFFLE